MEDRVPVLTWFECIGSSRRVYSPSREKVYYSAYGRMSSTASHCGSYPNIELRDLQRRLGNLDGGEFKDGSRQRRRTNNEMHHRLTQARPTGCIGADYH